MRNRFTLPAIFMLLIFTALQAYGQAYEWTRSGGSPSWGEGANGVVVDNNFNAYVTGTFYGTAVFNGANLTSQGALDVFLGKYDFNGNLVWIRRAGSNSPDSGDGGEQGYAVCLDAAGNIYVAGGFNGTADFGSYNITSNGSTDIFIAKYNSAGTCLWVKSAGGAMDDRAFGIAADPAGNVYICGQYVNSAAFNNGGTNISGGSMFVAKYNTGGVFQWVQSSTGGSGNIMRFQAKSIAYNGGSLYVTGGYDGLVGVSFGSVVLPSGSAGNNIYVVKFNSSNGAAVWGKIASGTNGENFGNGITTDPAGNIFVTGNYGGTITLGTLSVTSAGSQDAFTAKLNSSGTELWLKSGGGTGYDNSRSISYCSATSELFITGQCNDNALFGTVTIAAGYYDGFVTKYNPANGTAVWGITYGNNAGSIDEGRSISVPPSGNPRVCGIYAGAGQFGWQLYNSNGNSRDAFISKILYNAATIRGVTFKDLNNNGLKDAGEPIMPNIMVKATSGASTSWSNSNANGEYRFYMIPGTYNVTISTAPLYYTRSPVSFTASLSSLGQTFSRDLGLYPQPNANDLVVTVTALSNPRPGFNFSYQINYQNVGTTTKNGDVQFNFSNLINYVGATPAPSGSLGSTNKYWSFANLPPGGSGSIIVTFYVPTSVPINTVLLSNTVINPLAADLTPYNNQFNLPLTVRGAFDPNDKKVDRDTIITPQQIVNGDSLTYTIRFQNTGNAEAIDIVVWDTLSPKLDWGTLQLTASSHPCEFEINNDGLVKFFFTNIMLPDSNANEPGSHGFIKYQIKPKNDLVIGDIINNTAYIFFDFNVPVVTNTTVNIVNNLTGIGSINQVPYIFELSQNYPNPFNPTSKIKYEIAGNSYVKISVFDITGRLVQTIVNQNQPAGRYEAEFNGAHLASGVYFYKLEAGDFTATKKMILIK